MIEYINNLETGNVVRKKLNDNFTELKSLIDDMKGALMPQGNWDAYTNTPNISVEAETGNYWIVSVNGTTNIGGITDWNINDWVIKTATGWAKIDNTELVTSVAGKTGDVTLSKVDVGLTNVDNTSDANKPISNATQTALNSKANLASPTFTGTVGGITKSMVDLSNVDNTSDLNKPVSTATQNALNLKLTTTSLPIALNNLSGVTTTRTFKDYDSYVHTITISNGLITSWTKVL